MLKLSNLKGGDLNKIEQALNLLKNLNNYDIIFEKNTNNIINMFILIIV